METAVLPVHQVFIDRLLSGNFYPTDEEDTDPDGRVSRTWSRGIAGFLNNLGYTTYHAFSLLMGGEECGGCLRPDPLCWPLHKDIPAPKPPRTLPFSCWCPDVLLLC